MLESLKPRTCLLDIYGISSQYFDTSLKLLLFLTKFNRAELVAFAFSDYNFAENQNNLRSPDFQDFRFLDVCMSMGTIKYEDDNDGEDYIVWNGRLTGKGGNLGAKCSGEGGKLTVPACEVKKEKLEWEEDKERERRGSISKKSDMLSHRLTSVRND